MNPILFKILNFLVFLYCHTWRYTVHVDRNSDKYINNDEPHVTVLWHNQFVPLCFKWRHRNQATMASQSKDGELITKVLETWGYTIVRGSSSKGGAKALIQMKKLIKKGQSAAITVDGPRGPKYDVKPGAVLLSKISETPAIPVFCNISRYKRFNSWDQFILPMPFAKIDMYFTSPVFFDDDTSEEAIERDIKILKEIMDEHTRNICPDLI